MNHPAQQLDPQFLPQHIALVMDGNGRWAQQRGMKRTEGHKRGEQVLDTMVDTCLELGIPYLSAYAFSTENWRRSPEEVRFLMNFNRHVLRTRRDSLNERGVKIKWVGRRPRLWRSVIKELQEAEELTKNNTRMTLAMCINYGGRAEIVDAARAFAEDVANGTVKPHQLTENSLRGYLNDPDMPDVDLFLRPSGEQRTSNFLLWQSAYAEMVFQDKLFPDYTPEDLYDAIYEYAQRDRRFGGTK
ncbi:isoprenyl transferase [Corynebacterium argentoratense]|uniref:isoprenyl transferase n=1 Tax=Corynebacterium argentoratense TaxID=42817 RepID=UPI001F3224B1|nr:isoprenyl transferase [Corynebacterium argentoratense]MCF1765786.1 isoprenyl transferase [Corynebacterium argentoratense]